MTCSISQTVKEGSACFLQVEFFDPSGDPATPATVEYRIDCLTSGNVVKGDTSIGAASSVEIMVASSDNAMQDSANATERRTVTVTAGFGAGDAVINSYTYLLQNLGGV